MYRLIAEFLSDIDPIFWGNQPHFFTSRCIENVKKLEIPGDCLVSAL